nr:hypothetical protein [Dechloromonas sp.]
MQRPITHCLMVLAIAMTAGCASIFSGTTQDVALRTTPGAKFSVTNSYGTPVSDGIAGADGAAEMNLVRSVGYFSPHAYKVKLSKAGYKPQTVAIDPGINGWYFGNILLGGFIGMVIVDPLTGAMFRLVPSASEAMLEPTGEDLSAIEAEAAIIRQTRDYPISRHDYTARQVVRQQDCAPVGNPEVAGLKTYQETLTFNCRGGRQFVVTCRSGAGCQL